MDTVRAPIYAVRMRKIGLLVGVACLGAGIWACSSDSSDDGASDGTGDGGTQKDSSVAPGDAAILLTDSGIGETDSDVPTDLDGGAAVEDSSTNLTDGSVSVTDGSVSVTDGSAIVDSGLADSGVKFTASGNVTGLSGSVVLQNNAGGDITLNADGSFAFASQNSGSAYSVTVKTQPVSQTCVVTNGSGTLTANVTNVTVTCSINKFSVGGNVTGLSGSVAMLNNAGDEITVNADGTFKFPQKIDHGGTYAVTVKTQPTAPTSQQCVVTNDTGTLTADVANVTVTCTTNKYQVGGMVSGYAGFGLVLQNNAGDDVAVSANGSFAFPAQNSNTRYAVTVKTAPYAPIQSCVLANETGTVGGALVNNITVTCSSNALLAEYRFDEGTGTAALDSSGSGNDGTHNATYFATGKHGKALQMNASQGVTVANSPTWGAANADYTVEYWIYMLTSNGNWVSPFHKSNAAGADATRNPAHFFGPGTTLLYACIGTTTNSNYYDSTTNAWDLNKWTYVATVHSGSNQFVYRDGVLIKTDVLPSATIGGAGKLYIGKDPTYSGVNGYMDEVRVYGRALSVSEIQRDMQ